MVHDFPLDIIINLHKYTHISIVNQTQTQTHTHTIHKNETEILKGFEGEVYIYLLASLNKLNSKKLFGEDIPNKLCNSKIPRTNIFDNLIAIHDLLQGF